MPYTAPPGASWSPRSWLAISCRTLSQSRSWQRSVLLGSSSPPVPPYSAGPAYDDVRPGEILLAVPGTRTRARGNRLPAQSTRRSCPAGRRTGDRTPDGTAARGPSASRGRRCRPVRPSPPASHGGVGGFLYRNHHEE